MKKHGENPDSLYNLFQAIEVGNKERVRLMLEEDPSLLNSGSEGYTSLHQAIRWDKEGIVELLLSYKELLNADDSVYLGVENYAKSLGKEKIAKTIAEYSMKKQVAKFSVGEVIAEETTALSLTQKMVIKPDDELLLGYQSNKVEILSNAGANTIDELFESLSNITTKECCQIKADTWALSQGINEALEYWLKDIAHITNTELSSVDAPVDSEEGARNYAKKIVGYKDSDGVAHNNGFVHVDGGVLKKPIVMIINTQAANASSGTDVLAEGGAHWQCCVILPMKYKPLYAEELNNEKEIVFYIDSLYPKVNIPKLFKEVLTNGISYTFNSDMGKGKEEIIHEVTHEIPALCAGAKFIDGLTANQQLGGSDCGWWAVYNALMIVFTGRYDYLQQFKIPSRESAYKLRTIFPKLDMGFVEQINQTNTITLDSEKEVYDEVKIDNDTNSELADTASIDKQISNNLNYKEQDFLGDVIISDNGLCLAVIQDFEDRKKIELFKLNENDIFLSLDKPPVHSVNIFYINLKNIGNVKISNDGRFLFYVETIFSGGKALTESVCFLDLCLESANPTTLEEFEHKVLSNYIISPNGHFIVLKTIQGFIFVDVLEKKSTNCINYWSGVSFFSEDTIISSRNGVLFKLSLSKLKSRSEDSYTILNRQNPSDFLANMSPNNLGIVHFNKSRLIFIVNEARNPGILFYGINSNRFDWVTIPYLRSALKVLYLPGERLLCVIPTVQSVNDLREQPKQFELAILELKDGKAKRPKIISCPLKTYDYIGAHPALPLVVASSGKSTYYINLPHPSQKAKQYFFHHKDLIVTGEQLLKLGYSTFNNIFQEAMQQNCQEIFIKDESPRKSMLKIQSGKHWLITAGHLSIYPTSIDKRLDKWFPANIYMVDSEDPVIISEFYREGDALVKFPDLNDGSYEAISQYLHEMTKIELSPDIEKIISCLFNNQAIDNNNPPKHSNIAKTLLSRLVGKQYSSDYTQGQKRFFDCLLVLMFGVESSRNNLTFLTGIMLLDLIASNSHYGRKGHQYNWNNAFMSGPRFKWNDYENKDYGGKFPMATNSTGKGNLVQRRELISNGSSNESRDFQRERVQIREMSIIKHWLQAFSEKEPAYFSNVSPGVRKVVASELN